jgi:uncharacterized protein YbaR (Trm112 family)
LIIITKYFLSGTTIFIVEGLLLAISKLLLECPYCHSPLEVDPPDRVRSAFSYDAPLRGSYYGKVIKQKMICKNPRCKKIIDIYWYAPLTYFDRI